MKLYNKTIQDRRNSIEYLGELLKVRIALDKILNAPSVNDIVHEREIHEQLGEFRFYSADMRTYEDNPWVIRKMINERMYEMAPSFYMTKDDIEKYVKEFWETAV